jgi:hypothetical protein
MIVVQTMPWRNLCQNLVARRTFHARGGGCLQRTFLRSSMKEAATNTDDVIVGVRRYTNKPAPTTLPLSKGHSHHRSFSTDEIVIQDNDPAASSPTKCSTAGGPITSTSTTTSSAAKIKLVPTAIPSDVLSSPSQPQKSHIAKDNDQLILDLQRAHELFHQLCNQSKALLRNNTTATTSEEVVAMTNYFMILVNSLELEKHLEIVQSLQNNTAADEHQDQQIMGRGGANKALAESLRLAVKSMSLLHHVFLRMAELSLPPLNSALLEMGTEDNTDQSPQLYSAKTVRRALQLSRRAEELGLSLHRPMYQRLAVGIVLTSSPRSLNSVQLPSDQDANSDLRTPREDINKPRTLTLQLMELLADARSSFQIHTEEELVQLAEDILAEPVLLLLKSKQVEEVMSLLRSWQGIFGHKSNDIDVISLLGEAHTLKALEIVQRYTVDTKFMEAVESDPHVMELTTLLEVALEEILKGRKKRVEKISEMLWQLSLSHEQDYDYDDDKDDSDSEFGDEFDYDSDSSDEDDADNAEFDAFTTSSATCFTPSDSPIMADTMGMVTGDKVQRVSYASNNNLDEVSEKDDDSESFTILSGLSNKEARQSIYLRNGKDWVLPDIVSQLENWNKGNRLTFTPMFEQYIGNQIAKEIEDDDSDDDDDDFD